MELSLEELDNIKSVKKVIRKKLLEFSISMFNIFIDYNIENLTEYRHAEELQERFNDVFETFMIKNSLELVEIMCKNKEECIVTFKLEKECVYFTFRMYRLNKDKYVVEQL